MNLLKDVKAYYKVDDNIYTELTQEEFVDELDKLCIRLQNRIDKAIEYIEQKEISIIYQEFGLHQENVKNELLEILKGEE